MSRLKVCNNSCMTQAVCRRALSCNKQLLVSTFILYRPTQFFQDLTVSRSIYSLSSRQKVDKKRPLLTSQKVYFPVDSEWFEFFAGGECMWRHSIHCHHSQVYGKVHGLSQCSPENHQIFVMHKVCLGYTVTWFFLWPIFSIFGTQHVHVSNSWIFL